MIVMSKRILLYEGAVSTQKLNACSSMILFKNFIHYSNKKRNWQYHFFYPKNSKHQHTVPFKELNKPNIHNYTHQAPGSWYRWHFNANSIKSQINMFDNDFDCVFTNDVETAPHFNELFNRRWHFDIPILAYWDWVELPENGGNLNNFIVQCASVLITTKTGVNSQWQKDIIMKYAKNYFNDNIMKILDKKIQPLYIGIETEEIDSYPFTGYESLYETDDYTFKILWNHRISPQTGFNKFISKMDKIYKKHKNIQVIVTNPINKGTVKKRPYIVELRDLNRAKYFSVIRSCDLGVAYFQNYSAWSMSITDVIGCNIPVLVPNDFAFREMLEWNYPYLFKDDFEERLVSIIENYPKEYFMKKYIDKHDWNNRIDDWISFVETSFNTDEKSTSNNKKILDIVKKYGRIQKRDLVQKELGFGYIIKWTPFRNYLMNNGVNEEISKNTIYTTKNPKHIKKWL